MIGSGGREHALALALAADPSVGALHIAPGNAGTAEVGTNHAVAATDPDDVVRLARELAVDLVVIGPEAPLVAGVADALREAGFATFGPSGAAAQLEGSKAFAKQVMAEAGVPTAMAHVCTTIEEVAHALDQFGAPHVVKDDGLAGGKGVVVTDDRQAALDHAAACLSRPGGAVVVEEYLDGPEVSLFAITDGFTAVPLRARPGLQAGRRGRRRPQHRRAWAPTRRCPGPLTGLVDEIMTRVVQPTIDLMAERGTPFSGLLYAGLALTSRGLRVVEFNARFGDPETQVVLALLRTPLAGRAARRGPRDPRRGRRPPVAPGLGGHRRAGRPGLPRGPDDRRRPHRGARRRGRRVRVGRGVGRALRDGAAATATSWPPGAGCCAPPPGRPTSPGRASAPTSCSRGSRLEGGHYRRDIARAAAEGAHPHALTQPRSTACGIRSRRGPRRCRPRHPIPVVSRGRRLAVVNRGIARRCIVAVDWSDGQARPIHQIHGEDREPAANAPESTTSTARCRGASDRRTVAAGACRASRRGVRTMAP